MHPTWDAQVPEKRKASAGHGGFPIRIPRVPARPGSARIYDAFVKTMGDDLILPKAGNVLGDALQMLLGAEKQVLAASTRSLPVTTKAWAIP